MTEDKHYRFGLVSAHVCRMFNITLSDLLGRGREMPVTLARNLVVYVLREMQDPDHKQLSFPEIAGLLNRNTHSWAMTAYANIRNVPAYRILADHLCCDVLKELGA